MSSPWIDVAVAVAFVFFVFSMIVSALNEVINWVGQVRSKQLWSALHRLSSTAAGFGVVEAAPDVRPGVISMAHAWGDVPKWDAEVRTIGANTGRLTANDRDFDPITGIPLMSAIPVNVRRSDVNLVAR